MKKRLKMKRYEDGGDVDDDVEPEVIRRSSASGVRVNYEDKAEAKPKRKAAKKKTSKRKTSYRLLLVWPLVPTLVVLLKVVLLQLTYSRLLPLILQPVTSV